MAIKLQIANGFYKSKSLPLSHQECVNFYPSIPEVQGTLAEAMLFGTPGIYSVASSVNPREINRGAHAMDGIPYFVNGGYLYSLDSAYTVTQIGAISGTGRVSMADNGTQLMILVPGGTGYIYTVAGGLSTISDGDFSASGNPLHVVFIDGYFAATTDEKKWIISALNDGTSWNALDFGSAESDPDGAVAPVVAQNMAFIAGSRTTEGYQNVGGVGFPFQRSGVFLDKGCFAPFSIVNSGGTFAMVGGGKNESPAIWLYSGNNFKKISHTAIDAYLSSLSADVIYGSFGFSYASGGGYFIGFTFEGATTFVYDLSSGAWHERRSRVEEVDSRWRVNSIVEAYGKTLVGDSYDGRIGILDEDVYGEYGGDIIRTFTTQVFDDAGDPFALSKVELTVESGVGNATVPNPTMAMSCSRDGKTFNYERVRSIGAIGEYDRLGIWRGVGRFPRFGYLRFRLSGQFKPVVIKVEVE
jgi:hypothetical protein